MSAAAQSNVESRQAITWCILSPVKRFFEWFGELGLFVWRLTVAAITPPYEFRELLRQMDEIGSKSLPLVALSWKSRSTASPGCRQSLRWDVMSTTQRKSSIKVTRPRCGIRKP